MLHARYAAPLQLAKRPSDARLRKAEQLDRLLIIAYTDSGGSDFANSPCATHVRSLAFANATTAGILNLPTNIYQGNLRASNVCAACRRIPTTTRATPVSWTTCTSFR